MINIKCHAELYVDKPEDSTSKDAILKQAKQIERHNQKIKSAAAKKALDEKELKDTLDKKK